MTTTNLSTNSYHEWGTLAYADVTKGRVVAEDKGLIEVAYVSAETAYVQEKDTGIINVAYASTEAVQTSSATADVINGAKKALNYDNTKTEEQNQTIAKTAGELSVAAETGEVPESLKSAGYVAVVNKVGYTTLQEAITAANAGDTVSLLNDIDIQKANKMGTLQYTWTAEKSGYRQVSVGIVIDKDITINGNNYTITTTVKDTGDYSGVSFGINKANTKVVLDNLNITTTELTAIFVPENIANVDIIIKDSVLRADMYVIKVCDGSDNLTLDLNNVTTSGYNALNLRCNNSSINVVNSSLFSINDASESESNDFAGIVLDGDSYSCGEFDKHGCNNVVTIANSRVTADAPSGNAQSWLSIQYGASNNTIIADSSSIIAAPANWFLKHVSSKNVNSNKITVAGTSYTVDAEYVDSLK